MTNGEVAVLDRIALPPPSLQDMTVLSSAPVMGPLDRVSVRVFNVPELSLEDVRIDSGGNISIPLLGAIPAAGRTPADLALDIETRLRGRYVKDPQVTVNLRETQERLFSIDGAVTQPGSYPVIGQTTLMEAVSMARGANEFAKLESVVVFRTVGAQKYAAIYDMKAIRSGLYADPQIYPEDVILVGDSATRRFYRDAMQLLPTLTSPLILLLQ